MLFPRVTSRALVLWLLVLSWVFLPLTAPSIVLATSPTDIEKSPWDDTKELQKSYETVVTEGCTTPSLECLVHNIYQFISVEMAKNVVTIPFNYAPADDDGSSLPSTRPVAMGGAVGGLTSMMNGMYQRPIASSTTYIADVLESANVVTPAYAQGLGFAALDPILDLWKTFRNIAYIFFVLLFVIIGFMIMFRQKMGQTAITAQQAIPKIIIALILVTFSYAIAGFAIDLMYLAMTLIIGVFYNVFPMGDQILGYNILNLMSVLVGAVVDFGANKDLVSNIVGGTFGTTGNLGTEVLGAIGGTLLTVILAIAILIGTVRLFFELLRCYATVVLSVVVSPILLMMEAIPGKSAFKTWIKTLVGHLSPFPVVLLVLVMFYAFTDNAVRPTGGFMPPFLLGSGQAGNITSVMGLAIILALPDIVQHIRKAIAPENAFANMLTTGALKQTRAAAPLPIKAGTTLGMGTVGLGVGGVLAAKERKALLRGANKKLYFKQVVGDALRYGGNYSSVGSSLGGKISGSFGGKSPAILSGAESLIDKSTHAATEQERLKRAARASYEQRTIPQRLLSPGALPSGTYDTAKQAAEFEKIRKEKLRQAITAEVGPGKQFADEAARMQAIRDLQLTSMGGTP